MAKRAAFLKTAAIGLVFAGACARANGVKPQDLDKQPFKVCGESLSLEVADEPNERAIGLMHRQGVPAGTGMLFVFPRPQVLDFWMRNVPFDIDIGYFDANGKLLRHHTMKGTSSMMRDDALPRYSSDKPALFAVETPAGFFTGARAKKCRLTPVPKLADY